MFLRESKFVPISWCKKQTSVVKSLGADPCMDCISALDLWDLVVEVLHFSSNQPKAWSNLLSDERYENIRTKEQRSSPTRRKIWAGQMLITSLQVRR